MDRNLNNHSISGTPSGSYPVPNKRTNTMTKQKKVTSAQQTKLDTFSTKSAKIRYLDSQDLTRGQIAKVLNIRYQHVRNVLITPVKQPRES